MQSIQTFLTGDDGKSRVVTSYGSEAPGNDGLCGNRVKGDV